MTLQQDETLLNLLGLNSQAMREWMISLGEKPFHAQQVMKWIHQRGLRDFAAMTNLSKELRQKLQTLAVVKPLKAVKVQHSTDGTIKWLFQLEEGNCIETVYIPEDRRGTLCVSSQVGCSLNCSFCATAQMGFNRNLTTAEIIGQLWSVFFYLQAEQPDRLLTNVVFMGMGEPLLNLAAVVSAMDIMMDDLAYGLSKYRVTLSTSGVVPAMEKLSQISEASLAVSLHAPDDILRTQLVPINKKYPVARLMDVCRHYFPPQSKRKITFEYVMLRGINDSQQHAKQLVKLLQGVPAKVNMIPFNKYANSPYHCSLPADMLAFQNILSVAGIVTRIRQTRGDDVAGACGQLVGQFVDRTKRSGRLQTQHLKEGTTCV